MEFISHAAADGVTRATIEGTLSIYDAAEIKRQLIDSVRASRLLELDLSHVGEMDTAGLQLLVLAKREARDLGHDLRMVSHSPAVREVFEFLNMVAFFGDPLVIPASECS